MGQRPPWWIQDWGNWGVAWGPEPCPLLPLPQELFRVPRLLSPDPVQFTCPNCMNRIVTMLHPVQGVLTWLPVHSIFVAGWWSPLASIRALGITCGSLLVWGCWHGVRREGVVS